MKTKIIYISGNEVFEISEIRAAFDEVRGALGLDKDTILFGVPVDSDNALNNSADKVIENVSDARPTLADTSDYDVSPQNISDETEQQITTPEISVISEEELNFINEDDAEITEVLEEKNEVQSQVETTAIMDDEEPVNENVTEPAEDKIIPILSVLGGIQENLNPQIEETAGQPMADTVQPVVDDVPQEIISDINIDSRLIAPTTDDEKQEAAVEQVSIGDMIDEEAPMAPVEKTLEQLLESMAPLREDVTTNQSDTASNTVIDFEENDTDATLAQLASEFAENEDKIPNTPKAEHQGKIGKLKNILPFKKAKRDDGGLMGDLFGWAGIAANDEDFSIPGFFANAKKQGA